jgi:hypothetical protein
MNQGIYIEELHKRLFEKVRRSPRYIPNILEINRKINPPMKKLTKFINKLNSVDCFKLISCLLKK